ncbi:hypothetical protein KFU94_23650 [Chloroflexi bacterium TSY]|nr:hypothetical protein [Chloroflexi bacterium TSY]
MFEQSTSTESYALLALRNFSYIWLVLTVASLASYWFVGGTSNAEWLRRVSAIIHAGIWVTYLSSTQLQSRIRARYLPVALAIAVIGSFIVQKVPIFLPLILMAEAQR